MDKPRISEAFLQLIAGGASVSAETDPITGYKILKRYSPRLGLGMILIVGLLTGAFVSVLALVALPEFPEIDIFVGLLFVAVIYLLWPFLLLQTRQKVSISEEGIRDKSMLGRLSEISWTDVTDVRLTRYAEMVFYGHGHRVKVKVPLVLHGTGELEKMMRKKIIPEKYERVNEMMDFIAFHYQNSLKKGSTF